MHSGGGDPPRRGPGFPIRKPPDHSLAAGSPGNIAGSSVLHRLLVPRHPPCALKNLTLRIPKQKTADTEDARVHYAVLKQQTGPDPPSRNPPARQARPH